MKWYGFSEPYSQNKNKLKLESDLSDHATKSGVNDKLNIGKLKTVSVDLSKLIDVVKSVFIWWTS